MNDEERDKFNKMVMREVVDTLAEGMKKIFKDADGLTKDEIAALCVITGIRWTAFFLQKSINMSPEDRATIAEFILSMQPTILEGLKEKLGDGEQD